jgi:hypothetical protein
LQTRRHMLIPWQGRERWPPRTLSSCIGPSLEEFARLCPSVPPRSSKGSKSPPPAHIKPTPPNRPSTLSEHVYIVFASISASITASQTRVLRAQSSRIAVEQGSTPWRRSAPTRVGATFLGTGMAYQLEGLRLGAIGCRVRSCGSRGSGTELRKPRGV